jgi:type II secretory pathway component PulK
MDGDSILVLLALGPASAVGVYWAVHRHYRNSDKSHAFEQETSVQVLALTGAETDLKVDERRGTRSTRIDGDNVADHRQRVQTM